MVQTDLLKLEMKRLRDLLTVKKDELFALENRRQQLVFSMEERKHEIAAHRWLEAKRQGAAAAASWGAGGTDQEQAAGRQAGSD